MEKWKYIPDYEGIYEVSDKGVVRSCAGKTTSSALHGERKWRQRTLKQNTVNSGHKRVTLWKNKQRKDILVHRLVASAFLERPEGKNLINHKDGNPSNNDIENLEWCTSRENNNHAFDNRLIKTADPIILLNTETKDAHYFRSKAEASKFVGKNIGYIHSLLKKGINKTGSFEIYTIATNEEDKP